MWKISLFEAQSIASGILKEVISDTNQILKITEKINFSFFQNSNLAIVGAYDNQEKILKINLDTFISSIDEKSEHPLEIVHFIVHELRHKYQYSQIEKKQNNQEIEENNAIVNGWETNFLPNHYILMKDKIGSNNDYYMQPVEFDANAFAYAFMKIRYGYYNYETMPIYYKNSAVFQKAVEEYEEKLKSSGLTIRKLEDGSPLKITIEKFLGSSL